MRYIEKSKIPPGDFNKWQNAGGWHACDPNNKKAFRQKAWELKQIIKDILLREQGYICCYCEDRISKGESHIEHVKPKGKQEYAALVSDYHNLLCSCKTRKSCGSLKDDIEINISPLDETCETSFIYSDDGAIHGINQVAEEIIKLLKLDSERLTRARKGVIDELLWNEPENISLTEFDTWIESYLSPSGEGQLPRFWSATKQTAQKYRSVF